MTRRHPTFDCAGNRLVGTVDQADGTTGLLLVSGGNEIRSGTFGGQARLAARIAAAGYPVFRFDRRGVGDSEGANRGFRESREDIIAAIRAFRHECPQLERVVAFGNCDAASALMLMCGGNCDALVLSNPWTFEDDADSSPTPGAARSRYAEKLRNPHELLRLVKGQVDFGKLAKGIRSAVSKSHPPSPLAQAMMDGVAGQAATYLIAGNDRTGLAFVESCGSDMLDIKVCEGASHAYVEPQAREWLEAQILAVLRG